MCVVVEGAADALLALARAAACAGAPLAAAPGGERLFAPFLALLDGACALVARHRKLPAWPTAAAKVAREFSQAARSAAAATAPARSAPMRAARPLWADASAARLRIVFDVIEAEDGGVAADTGNAGRTKRRRA